MHTEDIKVKEDGMDNVVEKIQIEINKEVEKRKKLEEKLKNCNEKIKVLEAKRTETENAQIVSTIRELNIKPEELGRILASLKQNNTEVISKTSGLEEKAV